MFNFNLDKIEAEIASRSFLEFVKYINNGFILKPFNIYLMSRLEAFARGEIKNLMISMPPQHGKTELATRNLIPYVLGLCPSKKIAISSYSATIAHEFARDAKNKITGPEYKMVFPKTIVGNSKTVEGSFSDASYYYHTVPDKGFVYSVGRGGSITSKTIDLFVFDDTLKGAAEAQSLTIKTAMWHWYLNDCKTRLHNNSQQLFIGTRWCDDDLPGRILKDEADNWEVINFPAIKTADFSPYDKRKVGEVLFPEKHSLERVLDVKRQSEVTFNALYQGDPKPNKALMVHPDFIKVDKFPLDLINKWIVGIDFGWNDQTAVVKVGCFENKRYWQTILYAPGREIVKAAKANFKKEDEAANDIVVGAIIDALRQHDLLNCRIYCEHDKAKVAKIQQLGAPMAGLAIKSIIEGITKINECENYYLADDLFFYNEHSKYQFMSIGETIGEKPVDGNDHIMNAGRYAVYTDSRM